MRASVLTLVISSLFACQTSDSSGPDAGPADLSAPDLGTLSGGGPSDLGAADRGPLDVGEPDLGLADLGEAPSADAGQAPPSNLVRYMTGAPADAPVTPAGPGLVLMGGSVEVDDAFRWWNGLIAGGDVVILRTSGSDGYNDYLFEDIGGCDSVETLLVTSRALAEHPYVAQQVRQAEGIFLAGGDQSTYMENWKNTSLSEALKFAFERGAVLGGTSAGLAVLGEHVFAAYEGSITSRTALEDPFDRAVTLDVFLQLPLMAGVLTDSHFGQRDRLGRLVAFIARLAKDAPRTPVLGLGIDERTALVVGPNGEAQVMGSGAVHLVKSAGAPQVCEPGTPLTYEGLAHHTLVDGERLTLPSGDTGVPAASLSVVAGALQ